MFDRSDIIDQAEKMPFSVRNPRGAFYDCEKIVIDDNKRLV